MQSDLASSGLPVDQTFPCHSEQRKGSQIKFGILAQTRIEPEMFRFAQHDTAFVM